MISFTALYSWALSIVQVIVGPLPAPTCRQLLMFCFSDSG